MPMIYLSKQRGRKSSRGLVPAPARAPQVGRHHRGHFLESVAQALDQVTEQPDTQAKAHNDGKNGPQPVENRARRSEQAGNVD